MPRPLRIEYPGALYHVMARGNHQQAIFGDDHDRKLWLATLEEACQKTGWRIHAYVLMGNHYHLLVETPEPNLSAGMKWFQSTYTSRYNRRHGLFGHLFQGRFKAVVIDGREGNYFQVVSTYIHLNPARAGLIAVGQDKLKGYRWSSYPWYLSRRARMAVPGAGVGEPGLSTGAGAGIRGVYGKPRAGVGHQSQAQGTGAGMEESAPRLVSGARELCRAHGRAAG